MYIGGFCLAFYVGSSILPKQRREMSCCVQVFFAYVGKLKTDPKFKSVFYHLDSRLTMESIYWLHSHYQGRLGMEMFIPV